MAMPPKPSRVYRNVLFIHSWKYLDHAVTTWTIETGQQLATVNTAETAAFTPTAGEAGGTVRTVFLYIRRPNNSI